MGFAVIYLSEKLLACQRMMDESSYDRVGNIYKSRFQDQFGDDVLEIVRRKRMVRVPGAERPTCPGCRFPKVRDQDLASGFKYPIAFPNCGAFHFERNMVECQGAHHPVKG